MRRVNYGERLPTQTGGGGDDVVSSDDPKIV